jgi:hypothetical protein
MRYLYSLLSTTVEVLRSSKRLKIALEQKTADCRKSTGANPGQISHISIKKKNLGGILSDYFFAVKHFRVIIDPEIGKPISSQV